MIQFSQETTDAISAIGKLGSYVLALGVLVWALHAWNEERSERAAIEDGYRQQMVDIIKGTLAQAREDNQADRKLLTTLTEYLMDAAEREREMVESLDGIERAISSQTRSVKGSLKSLSPSRK